MKANDKPARRLAKGSALGIFSPSDPGQLMFPEKYRHATSELRRLGYRVIEGNLVRQSQEPSIAVPAAEARALEFMELVRHPEVDGLIATIGGYNASSILEHLDFQEIAYYRKPVIGHSDITALHMALVSQSKISSFYGPNVIMQFGEWPRPLKYTEASFKVVFQFL